MDMPTFYNRYRCDGQSQRVSVMPGLKACYNEITDDRQVPVHHAIALLLLLAGDVFLVWPPFPPEPHGSK